MKRKFPLFIIDNSRSHGKGRETDYISCTSTECPFVAEVVFVDKSELQLDADWLNKNDFSIYSEEINEIRIKIKVVYYDQDSKVGQIRSLLKNALKEYLKRQRSVEVNPDNIQNKDVIQFCDVLLGQTYENIRENPDDRQAKMVRNILTKIRNDYNDGDK